MRLSPSLPISAGPADSDFVEAAGHRPSRRRGAYRHVQRPKRRPARPLKCCKVGDRLPGFCGLGHRPRSHTRRVAAAHWDHRERTPTAVRPWCVHVPDRAPRPRLVGERLGRALIMSRGRRSSRRAGESDSAFASSSAVRGCIDGTPTGAHR
jgi:hypothetical protein